VVDGQPETINHDMPSLHTETVFRGNFLDLQCGIQIRMVAGFVEVIEREETLVAAACNHPNCLVIAFKTVLERRAA